MREYRPLSRCEHWDGHCVYEPVATDVGVAYQNLGTLRSPEAERFCWGRTSPRLLVRESGTHCEHPPALMVPSLVDSSLESVGRPPRPIRPAVESPGDDA